MHPSSSPYYHTSICSSHDLVESLSMLLLFAVIIVPTNSYRMMLFFPHSLLSLFLINFSPNPYIFSRFFTSLNLSLCFLKCSVLHFTCHFASFHVLYFTSSFDLTSPFRFNYEILPNHYKHWLSATACYFFSQTLMNLHLILLIPHYSLSLSLKRFTLTISM